MRRGDTNIKDPPTNESLDDANPSEGFLANCWQYNKEHRQQLVTSHDTLKTDFNGSVKANDIKEALEFLAKATGDPAFDSAALALKAYSLEGGLKSAVIRLLRENHGEPEWIVMPFMMDWVQRCGSIRGAAMRMAAHYGIPGQSFEAVVKSLTKKYPEWKASVESGSTAKLFPTGQTKRKLKVKLMTPWLGINNLPMSEIWGVAFGGDGFGLAPDDRRWRQLIRDGRVALFGVIEEDIGKTSSG